jgi:hypothetical protein
VQFEKGTLLQATSLRIVDTPPLQLPLEAPVLIESTPLEADSTQPSDP